MNIKDKHREGAVSAYSFFNGEEGKATAIQIPSGEHLKSHVTKTEALLVCLNGHARFENENNYSQDLKSGDFVIIEPLISHSVKGIESSNLILLK